MSMKPISRSSGRSAVAAIAYRSAEKLTNERDGMTHDYTQKKGVEHSEIVLPEGVDVDWARDRSALWNAAEKAEVRKDARVAREFEIALPHELTAEQRLEAARAFAQDLANRYGAAVDFAIHAPNGDTDIRNYHAHVMMTTRQVTADGFGEKTYIERENKWLLSNDLPTSHMQLRDIRQSWEGIANEHLAMACLDNRIDHRSHSERGLELVPTEHMGVHATQMDRRGLSVDRARLDAEAAQRNADLIREKPEQVLTLISNEKSVFDRHDVARTLHRYINGDAQTFQNAFAEVMASPALVELQAERADPATGEIELARYSTRELVGIESGLAEAAERLHQARDHGVDRRHVDRAIGAQDAAIQRSAGDATAGLSDEQRSAIGHITGPERIAAVVGYAGAGKSTMLAAAREAWEAQGYTVHGAALSGKAAEGLEESSGIASRTLASWDMGWQNDRGQLGSRDVFVIDEAGMVGSRQLARFVTEAEARGAKIVLVGDSEQLQAIGAGAPFRAIAERVGHAELSEVRRQRVDWQREASVAFATHKTAEGLAAYQQHGAIEFAAGRDAARASMVRDYLADRDNRPDGSRVAMAHRRADVRALNQDIRSALQDSQRLGRGADGGEAVFQTNDGERAFAPGDRIVFLENNRDLDVKNGMLGEVRSVEPNAIQVRLDGKTADGGFREITVPTRDYQAIDHGYATTIHKNQGATVDRSFVLASGSMDRHLTYVAMTRHRESVQLYADSQELSSSGPGRQAGQKLPSSQLVDDKAAYARLASRLSRSGAKETTLDYVSDFAARRGIAEQFGIKSDIEMPSERVSAERSVAQSRPQQPPERQERAGKPRRGMFDGLKLNAARGAPLEREAASADGRPEREGSSRVAPGHAKPDQEKKPEHLRPMSGFEQSVDRFARALNEVERQDRQGLPVLEGQKKAMQQAYQQLDHQRPGASRLIASAMQHDPQTEGAMYALSGRERVGQLVAGMDRERALQADPNVRADRLIKAWQDLQGERQDLRGWQNDEARGKVEGEMRKVAGTIERDPQVEAIVRGRAQELGINQVQRDQKITQQMEQQLDRDRSQGLER